MAIPPIPASTNMRYKAATPQAIDSLRNQLNSFNSQKKTNISQSTTVKSLTPPAPIVGIPAAMRPAKEDPISNIINNNPAPRQKIIVPGTKTVRGTTITEKKKTVKEVATDIQDPAGPNKPIGKSYREIHHKLEEEQIDELLSMRNPHKNTLGALEKRETKFIKKRSRPLSKKMIGRYFEEEQIDEMSAKEAFKLAKEEGFEEDRQSGSHLQMVHKKSGRRVTIPMHGSKDLKYKTAKNILQTIGRYEQARRERKLEEGSDYMNFIREEAMRKVKRMKAEETVDKGGKTDTGASGESGDRVTFNPEKDILKGQTR